MKVNDLVRIDCGVARVLSCSSTISRGVELWSATVLFEGHKAFVWGCFRLRRGVWFRYDPFSA